MAERQLKLGAILSGVGTTQNGWRHPDLAGDASVNIDWFIENAQKGGLWDSYEDDALA